MKPHHLPMQTSHLAVDIGNSGLRVVPVPADSQLPLPQPFRIDWRDLNQREDYVSNQPSIDQMNLGFGASGQAKTSDWPARLTRLLNPSEHSCWWISSVNRPALEQLLRFLCRQVNCHTRLIDYTDLPMKIEVDFPERVGIDRLLAAYAAMEHLGHGLCQKAIVIQAGSAVTVDLVQTSDKIGERSQGSFLGGAILPGVPIMLRLLSKNADLLPEMEADELINLPPIPGRNTEAAMLAGASSCLVGGVQLMVQRYREQSSPNTPIVISGGDGPLLAPHLPAPLTEIPQLVLQGIRRVITQHRQ